MEHKARTKALSWLLSLAMLLSLIPGMSIPAFAADATTLTAETTTWVNGDYVVPADGVTISGHITVKGIVNLTLTEGATLTANMGITLGQNARLNVSGKGVMVVKGSNGNANSTVAGTGKLVLKSGTLTATGGNGQSFSSGNETTGNTGGVAINGTVAVNGGTLAATGGNGGSLNAGTISQLNGGTGGAAIAGAVTINGGTLTATGGNGGSITITNYGDSNRGGAGGAAIGGAVTINGGTLTATKGDNGTLNIKNGSPNYAGTGSAGYDGTLTLGANVKLYEGTDDTGTVLDGNDSDSRVYSGEKKANMYAYGSDVDAVADKSELNDAITVAEKWYGRIKNNTDYTDIASALKTAIDTAKAVADNDEAGQDVVDTATQNLITAILSAEASISMGTTWEEETYVVPIFGETIAGHITVTGTVNLILTKGATLTVNAGITLNDGATLNVSGDGAMVINGTNGNANSTVAGTGELILKSGTLTANGGNGGSIGNDGYQSTSGAGGAAINGAVTVKGGTLTAIGGTGGSIGNYGYQCTSGAGGAAINGAVTVNGGTLTATDGAKGTGGRTYGCTFGAGGAGYSGTLTLGRGVKLYEGTEANEEKLLDGNDSARRVYEGEKKANMFAEGPEHVHEHKFTSYIVNTAGDTITATCSADGCTLPPSSEGGTDHVATLTIAAPQHTAVGDGKSADAQITDTEGIQESATVSYYAVDNDTQGAALGSAPTGEGKYWAEITLSAENNAATAHVVYEITNPDYNITLPTGLVGGTVAADKTSAKYGEPITLTVTPETGFTIKTVKYNDTTIKANEGVYSFTMPASNVTVSAEFEGEPFGITTEVSPANGGTVAIGGTGVVTANHVTTAKAGSTVTLTVNADTGFQVDTVKYNNTTITASEGVYKFTMPTEAVTVSATFVGKDTTATLNVAGDKGPNCTAKLLHDDYTDVTNDAPLTKKGGEQFILLVNRDEGYGFTVTYGTDSPALLEEFTEEEYADYIAYANENNLPVSSDMVLARVTMPGVTEDSVTLTVNFSKLKTFTILYQPSDTNTVAVWCKFAKSGSTTAGASRMHNDAEMGNGNKVFSLKVTAADNPDQLAFVTTSTKATTDDEMTALQAEMQTALQNATMITGVTESQNTNSWNDITGGKYLVIGGNAKTVVAAFVTDENAIPFYNSGRGKEPEQKGAGVTYRITVVANGNPGTVTAPAAPANSEKGTQFAGWSALVGTAPNKEEIKCAAGGTVQITENTSFNATWEPKQLTVTFDSDGGEGGSDKVTVNYKEKLPDDLEAPTKYGFALDGWTVDKSIVQDGNLFFRGSTFDLDTGITSNMGLTAEWKHVHTYTCYRLEEVGLQWFYDDNAVHVAFCSCYDYKMMAHEYDSDGMCACGKHKPEAGKVQLDVSYVQLIGGKYETKFKDKTRMEPQGKYVTLSASNLWGSDWSFSKWQYSTDEGNTWKDLAVTTSVKFGVMCNMRVRAVYEESADVKPQVELNASKYDDHFESYPMDNIAFQMSYKLPADCTFVDGGLRFGDNDGIGYYDIKERTVEGNKAGIWAGCMVMHLLTFSTPEEPETSYTERYYELRKNNALDEMSATELAKYIYEGKTTKAKVDPIYWDSKVKTEGNRGAIATRAPLNMTNAEDGNNWIYGIAWMRYKDADGKLHTIYTDALDTTLNGIVQGGTKSVTKTAAN